MTELLQEIFFQTNKSRHTIHIVAQIVEIGGSPRYFLAQITSLTPHFQPYEVRVHGLSNRYNDALEAFRAAFDWLQSYLKNISETITSIDNPCNCPFVSLTEEQAIVANAGLQIIVKVNGL